MLGCRLDISHSGVFAGIQTVTVWTRKVCRIVACNAGDKIDADDEEVLPAFTAVRVLDLSCRHWHEMSVDGLGPMGS